MSVYNGKNLAGETIQKFENYKVPVKLEVMNPNNIYIEPKACNPMDYFVKPEGLSSVNKGAIEPAANNDLKRKLPTNVAGDDQGNEDPLPKELTKQFLPFFCEVCGVHSNSSVSAKMHYDSKNHDKKVTAWLQNWSQETGEPIPKRKKFNDGPSGPNAFHCKVCDLALTSVRNANQHYLGRKHISTLKGLSGPSGSGYYGPDGNWIRTPKPAPDPTGRFNIGSGFLPADSTPPTDPDVYCAVCNISVSAKAEMKMHLVGSKHAKKLRAAGAAPYTPIPNDTILKSITAVTSTTGPTTMAKPRDNSIYRTPSGNFYCKTCNVTVATELMFSQHLASKKHASRTKQTVPT